MSISDIIQGIILRIIGKKIKELLEGIIGNFKSLMYSSLGRRMF